MTESLIATVQKAINHPKIYRALCLTSDEETGGFLRRELAQRGDGCLPSVLSLSRLAVAAHQYPSHSLLQLKDAARLMSLPPTGALHWWGIYAALPAGLSGAYGIRLAVELAHIMDELAERYLQYGDDNTLSVAGDSPFANEAGVIVDLWRAMQPLFLQEAQALEKLNFTLPVILLSQHEKASPLESHFLRHHPKCTVFRPSAGALEKKMDAALAVCGTEDAGVSEHFCECLVGKGESLGHAAKLALAALRRFSNAGDTVGVVVYDRLLARRLRALADTADILIADGAGWRSSTLSYGAALRCFSALAKAALELEDAEVFLQAPWWSDKGDEAQAKMAFDWRKKLQTALHLPQHWEDLTEGVADELRTVAQELAEIEKKAPRRAQPAFWLRWLFQQSQKALSVYADDPIAEKLRVLSEGIGNEGESLSGGEFCDWLDAFLDGEVCAADTVKSPVVFISPWQQGTAGFDSLLLLGISADTLPTARPSILGEGARQALGLMLRQEKREEERINFCRLLVGHKKIATVWQDSGRSGEKTPPSPFWELLTDAIERDGGRVETLSVPPDDRLAVNLRPPKPATANLLRWPEKLSVNAGGNLMQCPYWFFVKDILCLDDVNNGAEASPLLLGILLHRVLEDFTHRAKNEKNAPTLRLHWQAALGNIMQKAQRPRLFLTHWHWLSQGENFITWEAERRLAGWFPAACEKPVTAKLNLAGAPIMLRGRIDRLDENDGKKAIVDYKTKVRVTGGEFAVGEEPQLPLYAAIRGDYEADLILCQPVAKGKAAPNLTAAGKIRCSPRKVAARLRAVLRQISRGVSMPANGATGDCKKCPARRVCRREHWEKMQGDNL